MTKTKTMTNTIRDYLQRAILETVDNVCNLAIKSDTGQHSQVLQCFNNQAMGIVFFNFFCSLKTVVCLMFSIINQWNRSVDW